MRTILYGVLLLAFLSSQCVAETNGLPPFLKAIDQNAFFPKGTDAWTLQKHIKEANHSLIQWKNESGHEMVLTYKEAGPNTVQAVYKAMGEEIDKTISEAGGNVLIVKEFFAVILINDTPRSYSANLLYGTPEGVYLWKYRVPNTFQADMDAYIEALTFTARKHQYDTALRHGNIIMGRWGGPIHEFARLLAGKTDPRAKTVYSSLLQTSPSNYDAQIEYAALTKDAAEAAQSAAIVERDAEEAHLLNAAARILKKEVPDIASHPLFGQDDNGLTVILIPLAPCNPWILDNIAATYEKMTTIPVHIRRLPVDWAAPEPSRSVYRPYLEQIASNIWKTTSDFQEWPLSKLKDEIMKQAKREGRQAVASVNRLFQKMDEAGYQWDAVPIINWLSKAITPYFSKDPNTMVVGITELDIYFGESNFVFSLYGGLENSPVSLLSYAKMRAKLTGENQSRKRLTERAAKELVPASLKKLNIPRSKDPFCPYSYSSGLQRLEEKTLTLSEPVKKEIERIKSSIE